MQSSTNHPKHGPSDVNKKSRSVPLCDFCFYHHRTCQDSTTPGTCTVCLSRDKHCTTTLDRQPRTRASEPNHLTPTQHLEQVRYSAAAKMNDYRSPSVEDHEEDEDASMTGKFFDSAVFYKNRLLPQMTDHKKILQILILFRSKLRCRCCSSR